MTELSYAMAGALTGLVVGLTGVGGGALMTPVLLLVFDVPPTTAIATDLWFAAITKIVGASVHYKAGNVDWLVVKRMWSGSLPTALAFVIIVSLGAQIAPMAWLTKAIGVVVLITSAGLFIAPKLVSIARTRPIRQPVRFSAVQPGLTVISGAILGICVALTSVGAGAIGSVMLLFLYPLRMTPHRLIATDIIHAIPLAIVAGLGFLAAGMVDGMMLLCLLTGSVPTVIIGSLLSGKFSGRWIQMALAVVLMAAGVKVLH